MEDKSPQRAPRSSREPSPIGLLVHPIGQALRASGRNALLVQQALAQVLPAELVECVQVLGVRAGVLTLGVPDAAGRCLLEKHLRAKGLAGLRKALPDMDLHSVRALLT